MEVTVNGIIYKTHIDKDGVQRFVVDKLIKYLYLKGEIDFTQASIDYQMGCFTLEDYHRFYAGIGYSVCGFMDIFSETETEIENPLWK